ncbi:hypothetical protein F4818DRAFT_452068 [Hypoxylon cercidicola]|nr:hypothetical protein F4818DRAFT_452068 [Hypoxylon cercidicola]
MSYQYPPPRDDPEIDASQTSYMGSHLTPITSAPEGAQMSPARRRDSFSKEFKLKRSVSTPNVRPQGTNEVDHGGSGLPKEKKRNKLGYHRTPIACKHCRKRKIRCKQPETPDVLGRCESCINLQRDCAYTAVNQQPPSPPPSTGQRQVPSVGTSLASPSTSPAMPAGHPEAPPNPSYHQLATIPSMSDMGQQAMKSREDETYSPEPKVSPNAPGGRGFHYGHGPSGWMSAEAGATRTSHDAHGGSWAGFAHSLPETADYSSSYAPAPQTASAWGPANSLELGRINTAGNGGAWKAYPTTTRSISYSDDQYAASPSSPTRPYDGSLSAGAATPHPTYGGAAGGGWAQTYPYATTTKPHEHDYGAWYGADQGPQHSPEAHVSSVAAEDPSQAGAMYYGAR